jgi:hypothetical protein
MRLSWDPRDFRREAFEEACDGCFYLSAGCSGLPQGRAVSVVVGGARVAASRTGAVPRRALRT